MPSPGSAGLPQDAAEDKGADFETFTRRQRQIYMEAARLFVAKGFANTSMGDIAEAVGMSKAGLYHSIASKEDMLYRMIMFGLDDFEREVMDPARDVADPRARLETMIRRHVLNICRVNEPGGNPFTVVVNDTVGLSPERTAEVNARKRSYHRFVRTALEQLQAEGRLAEGVDPAIAAFSIHGVILSIARWRRRNGRLSPHELADEIAGFCLRGVLA